LNVSRVEASVLVALDARPHRITELAAIEGLTQPAITRLVDRLQERGLVRRASDPADGRVVNVCLSPEGREMLGALRAQYRAMVHEEMAALPDADVETLARAIDVLDELISRLKERDA
jgi:DNA-binding MarR family transcriptional regulator